jgi:hypothetical protein
MIYLAGALQGAHIKLRFATFEKYSSLSLRLTNSALRSARTGAGP